MRIFQLSRFTPLALALTAACGGGESGPDEVEENLATGAAFEYENAVNPNALYTNALEPSTLSATALSVTALAPNVLEAIVDPGEEGLLARQLLKYAVSCALEPAQSLSFSWTDLAGIVHNEQYVGLLSLAPNWASLPLSGVDQAWVSACLISRVNWYGVSVLISSRGAHRGIKKPSQLEISMFAMEEGAFWGNIFSTSPHAYACHHAPNDDSSRLHLRDCAAGHLDATEGTQECGIIHIVGACDAQCAPLHPIGVYRPECTDDTGVSSTAVLTTFLP